jgi:hypothetical protein
MSVLDLTAFDPMVKEHYSPFEVARMAMQKNRAVGMLAKSQKKMVGGREWVQPIMTALPGGGASKFSVAVTNAQNNTSTYKNFNVTRKSHYRIAKVDNQAIEATATGDEDAFESAFDEFDNGIEAEGNYINFRFFRTQAGEVGVLDGVVNVATVNLAFADPSSMWGIRVGEQIVASATLGSALRTAGATLTIATVNRVKGSFTTTVAGTTGIAALVNTDFIYLNGDADNAGGTNLAASGLADWVPDVAPSATTFYNVDRTLESDYLGGIRIDGTDGRSVANLLVDAVAAADNIGGDPDVIWMNPFTFGTLTKQLEGKWTLTSAVDYSGKKMATVGFKGFAVNLNGHDLTIYTDRCCPVKRIYVLTWSTWCMFSAGPAPNFLQKRAGSIIKVSEGNDGYEARIGEYFNFSCKAPGFNCVILLP